MEVGAETYVLAHIRSRIHTFIGKDGVSLDLYVEQQTIQYEDFYCGLLQSVLRRLCSVLLGVFIIRVLTKTGYHARRDVKQMIEIHVIARGAMQTCNG